jgi:hypothetical protein
MEQVTKRAAIGKLFELPLIFKFKRGRQERPAPRSQHEIDRLSKGWERKSESMRARMARIGI